MSYKSIKVTSHRDKLKRYASGGSAVKTVKKHEKNMHPDAEPTKFARGGVAKFADGGEVSNIINPRGKLALKSDRSIREKMKDKEWVKENKELVKAYKDRVGEDESRKSSKGPNTYARGGKVKTPSISITVNTTRNDAPAEPPMEDMGAAEMSAPPPMPPADMGMGAPPPPDMGMMPPDPGLGAPPMFKRGGTVRGAGVSGKNTTAGSGSGLGRLQKIGKAPPTVKR